MDDTPKHRFKQRQPMMTELARQAGGLDKGFNREASAVKQPEEQQATTKAPWRPPALEYNPPGMKRQPPQQQQQVAPKEPTKALQEQRQKSIQNLKQSFGQEAERRRGLSPHQFKARSHDEPCR